MLVVNLSTLSLKSNTTAMLMIRMMLKTYVPRNFFIMYLSSRVNSFMLPCAYNLFVTRLIIMAFHVVKSPAMMCFLASPTSQR